MKTIFINEAQKIPNLNFEKRIGIDPPNLLKKQFLFVRTSESIFCIHKSNISFLKACGNYTEIITSTGKKILSSKTLKYFSELLHGPYFLRTHQSYLINVSHISQINFQSGCNVIMDCKTEIPISRSRQSEVISLFQN